jgi:AcrR family transcriptional regulator
MNNPQPAKKLETPDTSMRRTPSQQRSRERVDRILACASELIAETGSEPMKMGDVAARAGISIGSLYQYFPDKSAIIRALAERIHASSRACIEEALAPVKTMDELSAAFAGLVDVYYGLFLAEPVMRDIWGAAQADRKLAELELGASRIQAELLEDAMRRVTAGSGRRNLGPTALLIWQLGEAAMRLAISLDRKEGNKIVEAYKRMAIRELVGD